LDVAVRGGAADTVDGREGLTLSLRKIGHVCRRVVERRRRGVRGVVSGDLSRLIHDALMTGLMPERERRIV